MRCMRGWVRFGVQSSGCSDLIAEKSDLIRKNAVILRASSYRVRIFLCYNVESGSPASQINRTATFGVSVGDTQNISTFYTSHIRSEPAGSTSNSVKPPVQSSIVRT